MKSILELALEFITSVCKSEKQESFSSIVKCEGVDVVYTLIVEDGELHCFVVVGSLSCELNNGIWTIRFGDEIVAASNAIYPDERYIFFPANSNFIPLEEIVRLPVQRAVCELRYGNVFTNVRFNNGSERLSLTLNNPGTNEHLSSTPDKYYSKDSYAGIESKYYAAEIVLRQEKVERLVLFVFDVHYESHRAYWLSFDEWKLYNVSGRIPPGPGHDSLIPYSKGKTIPDNICIGDFEGIREYLLTDQLEQINEWLDGQLDGQLDELLIAD